MNDLITLNCPSCGGKLQVNPDASMLVCEHCSTEHMIHREGDAVTLESFARCPRCNRNDRAEKVSAILSSHTQNIDSEEWRTEVYYTPSGQRISRQVAVPKKMKQTSELAKKLSPPEKPKPLPKPRLKPYPSRKSNVALTVGIILLVLSFISFVSLMVSGIFIPDLELLENPITIFFCIIPSFITLVGSVILTILGIINSARLKDKHQKAWSAAAYRNRKATQQWQEANDKVMSRWQNAMERWNALYYCHRDDCVFIPEEGTYAALSKMKDYLFQE